MSSSTSSTEPEWVWQPAYGLYYNPITQVWARPGADGRWEYSNADGASTSSRTLDEQTPERSEGTRKYFDRDAPDAEESLDYAEAPTKRRRGSRSRSPLDLPAREHFLPPLLRLVVQSSDTLPPNQTIAIISPSEPLTIGRDRSFDKRLRLKALACSKTHASLFWMAGAEGEEEGHWAVADYGSTQGTWLGREGKESRLSVPKVASEAVRLVHDDSLRIGDTVFKIHIHASLACDTCALLADSSNLIPLSEPLSSAPTQTTGLAAPTLTKSERGAAVRQNLKDLKSQFLNKPTAGSSSAATGEATLKFVDRAKARRARNGTDAVPAHAGSTAASTASAGAGAAGGSSPFFTVPGSSAAALSNATSSASAQPRDPFDASSRGARLLGKLTKTAPSEAGALQPQHDSQARSTSPSPGLGRLIEARGVAGGGKAGLGSRALQVVGQQRPLTGTGQGSQGDWRENVREMNRRRFKELGAV